MFPPKWLSVDDPLKASTGQKFFPRLDRDKFELFGSLSPEIAARVGEVGNAIYADQFTSLGYPDAEGGKLSNYYPGSSVNKDEIRDVQEALDSASIRTTNTRLRKIVASDDIQTYHLLVASILKTPLENADVEFQTSEGKKMKIEFKYGDHANELCNVNSCLTEALPYVKRAHEVHVLKKYIECFHTGNHYAYKEAQAIWTLRTPPNVEISLGFTEFNRDPHDLRAEWRGFVMIRDDQEVQFASKFWDRMYTFMRLLPWSTRGSRKTWSYFEVEDYPRSILEPMKGTNSLCTKKSG